MPGCLNSMLKHQHVYSTVTAQYQYAHVNDYLNFSGELKEDFEPVRFDY